MPLGPLPYEVVNVEQTESEKVNGHYIYSEISELHGGDGLYGVGVLVSGDSLSDKLRRVISFRSNIPDSVVIKEFQDTTRDGFEDAVAIEEEIREEAIEFVRSR